MTWTLEQAVEFWRIASVELGRDGFLCGIYGSVLSRNSARDLDMLVIPKRINTSFVHAVKSLAHRCMGSIGEPYHGLMGTAAYLMYLPTGQIVDLQFYKPNGLRDAEDMWISRVAVADGEDK